MAELAADMHEQILLKMGVEDLIRCKSVCKSWQSLISSPNFIKNHMNISYQSDRKSNDFGHRRIIVAVSSFLYVLPHFEVKHNCRLIGSSNGLVCISTLNAEILVINPSIGEVKKLKTPHKIDTMRSLCWGFGYDSSADDFKVILGFQNGEDETYFQVLGLKSNVWKVIGDVKYSFINGLGMLCDGGVHWFMKDQNKKKVILSFDISAEEFKEIPQPDDVSYHSDNAHNLGIMDECICIFNTKCLYNDIWVMNKKNNDDIKQSWERVDKDCLIKHEAAVCFKILKNYIPNKRSFTHGMRCWRTHEFTGAPIFVRSLVSPHVNGRPKRKRLANNWKSTTKLIKSDPSVPGLSARI